MLDGAIALHETDIGGPFLAALRKGIRIIYARRSLAGLKEEIEGKEVGH